MHDILIIGAGQIGSRHLQAIKKTNYKLNIQVVDINVNSLNTAKQRYDEIKNENIIHKISYFDSLDEINEQYDITIIATSSNVRYGVLNSFFKKSSSEYIILEKILFDDPRQYREAENILNENRSTCWVNCPRRIWDSYQPIFNLFSDREISFHITGSNFNLMSNYIHFLDLISWICGSTDYELNTNGLIPKLISSKRHGFQELFGVISTIFNKKAKGTICCLNGGNLPTTVYLEDGKNALIIDETNQISHILNDKIWITEEFHIPYQSDLTDKVVEKIITDGACGLTSYKESMELHLPFINYMLDFLNQWFDDKYAKVPFT